jgi:hypothetical protein
MNEDRRKILQMLSTGQVTADEAERLIAALEKETSSATAEADGSRPKAALKYLRVVVQPVAGGANPGPNVNVRVPMQLLRAGVRLAGLIPIAAQGPINQAMREKGLLIDVAQIKPENLEELVDQLRDLTVEVDEKDVKVRVFCE